MLRFLLSKHWWRNLPRCRISFSLLFFIILINFSLSLEHISSTFISRNNKKRSSAWKGHTSIKCSSSSISLVLQKRHVLCDASSFGFWCLPVSIRSICELVLNLLRDHLIWGCFIWVRYGSIWNSVLNSLYVRKIGLATEFCIELYQSSIYVEYIFSLIWLLNPDRSVCCLSQSAPWPYILRMFCILQHHVECPLAWRLYSSSYTHLTTLDGSIVRIRCQYLTTFRRCRNTRGKRPVSP